MGEEKQLTLEEMLSLAGKVENWKGGSTIYGSLRDIKIEIGVNAKYIHDYYIVIWKDRVVMGKCKGEENASANKKIKPLYDTVTQKIATQINENEQKAREDALKYARDLLKN